MKAEKEEEIMRDCRPGQQFTNGQLDYLITQQFKTHCNCGKRLPLFRDPKQTACKPLRGARL